MVKTGEKNDFELTSKIKDGEQEKQVLSGLNIFNGTKVDVVWFKNQWGENV